MMNQREAVFAAVSAVTTIESGKAVTLSKEQLKEVHAIVINGFLTGQIELKGDRTPEWVSKYVPGLVNNWMRKDKNLNGGIDYVAKNPGSRTGSGDETLRAMKQLLGATTDPTARGEIQKAIDERVAELKPKLTLNVEALPPALRRFAPPTK